MSTAMDNWNIPRITLVFSSRTAPLPQSYQINTINNIREQKRGCLRKKQLTDRLLFSSVCVLCHTPDLFAPCILRTALER